MNKPQIAIRELRHDDYLYGFLETISNLSKEDEAAGFNKTEFLRTYHSISSNWRHKVFVAVVDNQIVGSATILIESKFIHRCSRAAHIEDVVTRQGYEGRGVATALMKKLEEVAKQKGSYKIILDCSDENMPFYEKLGYHRHENMMRKSFSPSG